MNALDLPSTSDTTTGASAAVAPPRVTIHLQGGRRIGMGHVFRMLWLARHLRARGLAIDMVLRGDRDAEAAIHQAGFAMPSYPVEMPAAHAITQYLGQLQDVPSVWINDCLKVDRAVNAEVKRRGIPIIAFDDAGAGLTHEDVVINAMPSFWRDAVASQARMCQGPVYMVLDPDVRRFHDAPKTIPDRVATVAVTFGGSDPHGMLFKVLRVIETIQEPLTWQLFVGPLFARTRQLQDWQRRLTGHPSIQWHQGEWHVIPYFAQADVAISASGHTLFEMLGLGIPTVAIANAPHELVNGRYFAAQGTCRFLGLHAHVSPRAIAQACLELVHDAPQRRWLSQRSRLLVDGRGTERVTALIIERARAPLRPQRRTVRRAERTAAAEHAPRQPSPQATQIIVADSLDEVRRHLAGLRGTVSYLVLSESATTPAIRAYLRARPRTQEIPRIQWTQERGARFQAAYVEFMAALNWRHDALVWRAMPFTNKNLLSMSLCRDLCAFLCVAEVAQRDGTLVVVTDSVALLGQLRRWGAQHHVRILGRLRQAHLLRRWLADLLPLGPLYGWLRSLLVWWLARRHRLPVDRGESVDVITTAFPPSAANAQGWREAYFGPLPSHLTRSGRRVLLLALCFGRSVATLRAMQRQPLTVTYVPVEAALCLGDLIRSFVESVGHWWRRPPLRGAVTMEGFDVSDLVRSAIRDSCRSTSLFSHLCIYRSAQRLGRRARVERWFYPFENRAWEKMILTGLRQTSPGTRCIGFQHAAISPSHLNFVLGQDEVLVTPLPDLILAVGQVTQAWLQQEGQYPAALLRLGCALRHAAAREHTPAKPRSGTLQRVLVALASSRQEYCQTYAFIRDTLQRSRAYEIRFRPHPEFPFAGTLRGMLAGGAPAYTVSHQPLAEDLDWADVVLYASSTVCLEALALGLPVIHLQLGELLSMDPLWAWDHFKWSAATPEQLLEALRQLNALPADIFAARQQEAQAYARAYLRPVTAERLQEFADA